MIKRRKTREVKIGDLIVGGEHAVTVQSMTTTKTHDVKATLKEVERLEEAGCQIIRITVPDQPAADALYEIKKRMNVPLVADIHFNYRMALEAVDAGADKIRINPGNIGGKKRVKEVLEKVKNASLPIRIGVNAGSLEKDLIDKYGYPTPEAMVESALTELNYFDEVGFDQVKISVKASNVPLMVEAYRQLSSATDHPLHLGVTEAGPPPTGLIKSTAGIASLLLEGIGDTIRFSLTADPIQEAKAGRQLLEALGLRERKNVDLIACPSCGRAEIDVYDVASKAQAAFEDKQIPLQIAVMGCVVNGPGEARDADLGIAAGNKRGHLFVKGQNVAVVKEDEMVETLVQWAEFITENGFEAALARADMEKAQKEAEKDRKKLLAIQGEDVNEDASRVDLIRKI